MKTHFIVSIVLLTALMQGCSFDSDSTSASAPNDKELIEMFTQNKEVFIQLKTMMLKDGYSVISIDPEWSDPNGIPENVKKEYYRLLEKINVIQIRKRDIDTVVFTVWNIGNVSGGHSKGYILGTDSQWHRKEKKSLDDISSFESEFFYKRKIDENWSLYYDYFL